MKLRACLFNSSLGQKYLMAGSGLALFLFVAGHLLGNLQFFFGPEPLNRYGHLLQNTPGLLWAVRLGLLTLVGLHITTAVRLLRHNRQARAGCLLPIRRARSLAGLAHDVGGRLGHRQLRGVPPPPLHRQTKGHQPHRAGLRRVCIPGGRGEPMHNVFKMMVAGFSNSWVSGFYLLGLALLSLHLSHGLSA